MQITQIALSLASHSGTEWFRFKSFVEHSIGFHDDALHVLAGVLILLMSAALLRSSVSRVLPWLTVFTLELANEMNDVRIDIWPADDRSAQLGEGLKDVLLTMALPTVLLLVARHYQRVLR